MRDDLFLKDKFRARDTHVDVTRLKCQNVGVNERFTSASICMRRVKTDD